MLNNSGVGKRASLLASHPSPLQTRASTTKDGVPDASVRPLEGRPSINSASATDRAMQAAMENTGAWVHAE